METSACLLTMWGLYFLFCFIIMYESIPTALFRTIANSVATVLRNIPLTYVHYVSMDYFSVSLVGVLQWPTTVTAKANRSWQFAHGKSKFTHGKSKSTHGKSKSTLLYFYPVEYTSFFNILLAILQFAEEFLVLACLYKFRTHRQRPEEASKHNIYPQFRNEITEKLCVFAFIFRNIR